MKRFLDLEDLSDEEISTLLDLARQLVEEPRREVLGGKVLGLLFMNPSLRTLASFQAGMGQLGGSSFVITPGSGTWQLETRPGVTMDGEAAEHVREAIPVLEEYADALGIRCFGRGENLADDLSEPVLASMAELARKPLINLESAFNHPCQALADWKTLDDLAIPKRARFVLSWAWHPNPLPLAVPSAVAAMAARRGMDLTILRPDGFGLPEDVMTKISAAARRGGGVVEETSDRASAIEGAHVIYAKSWQAPTAYGNPEAEAELRRSLRHWCVAEEWFDGADAESVFLHCLPVRRNVVVEDAVLDGPRSQVVRQAGNRLHVQKALLWHLIGGEQRDGDST